jgi:hypothetical protein
MYFPIQKNGNRTGIFEYHDKMLLKEIMQKRVRVVPGAIPVTALISSGVIMMPS